MKEKRSRRPYKISTTSIGDLIQAQARSGNAKAKRAAKTFLSMTSKNK